MFRSEFAELQNYKTMTATALAKRAAIIIVLLILVVGIVT